jgi:enamine deaminase RidA (YjgF/YER057c/UK114 family)
MMSDQLSKEATNMATPEAQLTALGIVLGEPAAPIANFVPTVRTGQLLYVSGQICFSAGKVTHVGQVGAEVSIEDGKIAARYAAINVLAHVRKTLGSLDKVVRVVQLQGFVNAGAGFGAHPVVINGASDLIVSIFGDAGKHSRFAVGVSSLPSNAAVEVAATFEVKD